MTNAMRVLMTALVAMFLAAVSGCGFDIDIKDGTSIGFDDGVVDLGRFETSGSSCVAKTSGERELEGYKLLTYRVTGLREGDQASAKPPTASVKAERTSGVCPGETSRRSPTDATAADEVWYATGGSGDFLSCAGAGASDCGRGDAEACSGAYRADILNEQGADCDSFDPAEIQLGLSSSGARRRIDDAATCEPGSGRFRFVAAKTWDRDDDGLIGAELVPFRVSGAGTLTTAAWIRSVKVVEGADLSPRIIKVDRDFAPDEADRLTDAAAISIAASAAGRVAEGVLGGYAPFVVEEVERGDLGDLVVDMTWTCGEGGVAAADRGAGAVLDLAAAGCGVDQALVLRPGGPSGFGAASRDVATTPHVRVELHGDPNHAMKIPAKKVGDWLIFDHDRDRLSVAGALAADGSALRLDRVEWLGVPLCDEEVHALRAL